MFELWMNEEKWGVWIPGSLTYSLNEQQENWNTNICHKCLVIEKTNLFHFIYLRVSVDFNK